MRAAARTPALLALLLLVLLTLLVPTSSRKAKKLKKDPTSTLKRLKSKLAALPALPACGLPRVDARTTSLEEFRANVQERAAVLIEHGTPQWAKAMGSWNAANTSAAHGDAVIAIQDPELLVKRG